MTEPAAPPQAARCATCRAARLLRDRHDLPDYIHHLRHGLDQLEPAFADFRRELDDLRHELRRRCWFAPHDMRSGAKLHEQIESAINTYDRLLLILSDRSMASEWVKTEVSSARQREMREGRRLLFPISLVPYEQIRNWTAFDADIGKDPAREVREYYIPDVSDWRDPVAYREAVHKLVEALRMRNDRAARTGYAAHRNAPKRRTREVGPTPRRSFSSPAM